MATLLISGIVIHQNGNPIHNITVVINERQLRSKKKLIEGLTPLVQVPDSTPLFPHL